MSIELLRGHYRLPPHHRGCFAAFGGFDGLHLGHRAVIDRALSLARRARRPAAVVLFEPLPKEFFDAQSPPSRLYPLRERAAIIASWGIERVVCLRFNAHTAESEAAAFVENILVDRLGVHTVVVGEGFQFGRGKSGDVALLQALATRYGFAAESVCAIADRDGHRISSTAVREALASGDLARAARLLGRDYSVSGRVGHGDKRGAQIGFPTANLMLGRRPPPLHGVFAAVVEGVGGKRLPGVVNAGYRPTFNGRRFCFEVHLPDFSDNLYGRRLRVRVLAKIRDEQRFDRVGELRACIREDIERAMALVRPVLNTTADAEK